MITKNNQFELANIQLLVKGAQNGVATIDPGANREWNGSNPGATRGRFGRSVLSNLHFLIKINGFINKSLFSY